VLLVHGLAGHAEGPGDGLPGPTAVAGLADVGGLEVLEQPPEGGDGPEADVGVIAVDLAGELLHIGHDVNLS
jgi:hypothetical protein